MSLDHPGFADPVRDAQATFRAVLDAMARPGRIHTLAAPAEPPPGLDRATAAILLTLADADSPVHLGADSAGLADWVAFHCGAPLVARAQARLAVAHGAAGRLAGLATGSDEAPEDGATLILQVAALGTGEPLQLSGPGLRGTACLHVAGLPPGFAAEWAANHAGFPRGVDVILCAGPQVAALPRSVRLAAGAPAAAA